MRRRNFIALFGGAIAWPLVARPQQPGRVYRVAIIAGAVPLTDMTRTGLSTYQALYKELESQGFVEGQNLVVDLYTAEGKAERFATLPREVALTKPDVLLTFPPRIAEQFKKEAPTIPIVVTSNDPVAEKLVQSLARPGGTITGVSSSAGYEIWGKRMELLKQVVPQMTRIAFLVTKRMVDGAIIAPVISAAREMAERMGLTLLTVPVDPPLGKEQLQPAFETVVSNGSQAFLTDDSPEMFTNRVVIIELAAKHHLPAMYPYGALVVGAGGLMAYSPDYIEQFRHLAVQISQILKGANPGDIPFYQVTKYNLLINLKTAKELGIEFPPSILVFASEVIE